MTVMYSKLVGSSEATMRLQKLISMVAPSNSAVIIQGQTGVGQELVAESVHDESRGPGNFVAVNCAATPRDCQEAAWLSATGGWHVEAVVSREPGTARTLNGETQRT